MDQVQKSGRPRVAIVASILNRNDGISKAVWHTYKALFAAGNWDVCVLSSNNDFDDMPVKVVTGGIGELLLTAEYNQADIIIYHFGTYHSFFDALLVGNGHAKQVVVFHNITPAEFVPERDRAIIRKAFSQLHNLRSASEIWPVSEVNARVLEAQNIGLTNTLVIPLVVEWPPLTPISEKKTDTLEFLFLGRAVPSKGLSDCIKAFSILKKEGLKFQLSVVGNLAFSDAAYLSHCKELVAELELENSVAFLGTQPPDSLNALLKRSHIIAMPSYHEGFCIPIIEGLRAGCIPVCYDSHNLPFITAGLGRTVPTGDITAFAAGLSQLSMDLKQALKDPDSPCLQLDIGRMNLRDFEEKSKSYVRKFESGQLYQLQIDRLKRILNH